MDCVEQTAMSFGFARADRLLDTFEAAFALLARHPGSGHLRFDLDPQGRMRFWHVHGYLLAYLPDERPLFIARLFHGARDPEELRAEIESDDHESPEDAGR